MGAQCPCTCRRRRPPASRVVVAPSTLAVQIHPPVSQPQDSVPCRSCDMASHAPASVVESVQLLLFCFGGALIFLSFPLRVDRIACDSEA